MKVTKAFLSKKKKDQEENKEEEGKKEIWRDVDRGKLREGPKERKNSARGGHSSSSKVRGGYDIKPYSIYKGRGGGGGGPAGET